jgi:tetratricopeptide (TPR) repeat protein
MASTTQSVKTPLRANVSEKLSADNSTIQLISRDIVSSTFKTHVICGPRGIGKTWTAHIVVQLPLCKTKFSNGVIWLGLSNYKELNYTLLRSIYQRICAQLNLSTEPDFNEVLYAKTHSPNECENDKKREMMSMIQLRKIMSRLIGQKSVLLCVDGLYDCRDIKYFEFHSDDDTSDNNCCLVVTVCDAPDITDKTKVWQITNFHVDEAKSFFLRSLNPATTQVPDFLERYSEVFRTCHGNPLSIKTLCHLVDDKIESQNYQSLDAFVNKFENVPIEAKIQVYNILEAAFTNSSLGPSFNKIIWRCFAAFTAVFKRDDCLRPCIGKSPVQALFSAVMAKIGKSPKSPSSVESKVDKVINFLVKIKVLTQIDGFDDGKIPRTYLQMSCDAYQEFGEQLSSSAQTNKKLHQLFINEYTTMFSNSHTAFGANEIDNFMLKWLPYHLRKSGDIEDQALTLPDYRFIQERVKFMGTIEAVDRHVDDAESFVRMSSNGSNILLPSYEAFTRILESLVDDKENGDHPNKIKEVTEGMWRLAISLFSHYYVKEGCQLIQKAKEYEDEDDPVTSIDAELFQKLSESSMKDDHLNTVRSLVKIGAAMARSNRRQHATNIILLGLKGLIHCLGSDNIEVARAHVFVGEVFYRDLKLYEDAMAQFRLSLPLLLKELGEESEEVFDAIILCGKTYVHLGFLDTALEILEKIAPQLQGGAETDVRMKVASIYMIKGEPKAAIAILNELKGRTFDEELRRRIEIMGAECSDFQRYTI